MNKFKTKPVDDLISAVEQWRVLNDNSPVSIEVDELHQLIHGAEKF